MVLIETWFAWLSSMPTCIIVTMMVVSVFKMKYTTKESEKALYERSDNITIKKGNEWFTWCGIICLIAFWIRSTIQAIVFTVLIIEDRHQENVGTSLGISWLFYGSGLWLMLVSFVLRIQYTFKGTHLEYSQVIIRILYCLLILGLIEVIFIFICVSFLPHAQQLGLVVAYIAIVSHFAFSCILTFLLFSKIFILMQTRLRGRLGSDAGVGSDNEQGGAANTGGQEMTTINQGDNGDNQQTENEEAGLEQISLTSIDAVTRYALLMFVGIVSTYICSILVFIDVEYGWSVSYHILTWGSTLVGFDLLVNATTVYMLFQYNSAKYYKLCKVCHKGCNRCCVEMIYCFSRKSSKYGVNAASGKSRQEFATLILTADDGDDAIVL